MDYLLCLLCLLYIPPAIGGPAMTWGMFAVGYIELGDPFTALARANFNRSFANAQVGD